MKLSIYTMYFHRNIRCFPSFSLFLFQGYSIHQMSCRPAQQVPAASSSAQANVSRRLLSLDFRSNWEQEYLPKTFEICGVCCCLFFVVCLLLFAVVCYCLLLSATVIHPEKKVIHRPRSIMRSKALDGKGMDNASISNQSISGL